MNLNVGQDATVGEVIDDWIRMLYSWGGRLPKLDEALREDLKWKLRLFAFGRISRIAEGELEADDDFPRILVSCLALEGFSVTPHFFLRKIVKFDAEGLAVLEANTTTLQRSDLYYSCSAITFVSPAK